MAKGLLYGAGAAAAAVTERRGTTAAHVLDQLGSPRREPRGSSTNRGAAGASALNPNIKRNCKRAQEGVHRARGRVQGNVCDGRTRRRRAYFRCNRSSAIRSLSSGRGERRAQRSPWGVEELPATLLRRAAQQ